MIYFIHGYQSSVQGSKAIILQRELGAIPIKYRDCSPEDLVISDCLIEIQKNISEDKNPVLIGSSLGGLLATLTAFNTTVDMLILLNPAVIPPNIDIRTISDMPQRILKEMKDPRPFREKLDTQLIVFSATEDNVVPPEWVLRFSRFQEATVQFLRDDHRFSAYLEQLPNLMRMFLQSLKK